MFVMPLDKLYSYYSKVYSFYQTKIICREQIYQKEKWNYEFDYCISKSIEFILNVGEIILEKCEDILLTESSLKTLKNIMLIRNSVYEVKKYTAYMEKKWIFNNGLNNCILDKINKIIDYDTKTSQMFELLKESFSPFLLNIICTLYSWKIDNEYLNYKMGIETQIFSYSNIPECYPILLKIKKLREKNKSLFYNKKINSKAKLQFRYSTQNFDNTRVYINDNYVFTWMN